MSKYRWLGVMVSTMTLAVLMLGFFQGSADAASKRPQATPINAFKGLLVAHPSNPGEKAIPFVTCHGDQNMGGCTGQDPHLTGCDADQETIDTAYFAGFNNVNNPIVLNLDVDLMWSPTCQTNWTRLTLLVNITTVVDAVILRGDGYSSVRSGTLTGVGSQFTSTMAYSPVFTGRACGLWAGALNQNNQFYACTSAL